MVYYKKYSNMSRYWLWVGILLGVELVSALTFSHPHIQSLALGLCAAGVFLTAVFAPSFALSAVLMEYIVGSKGALLRAGGDGLGHGGVSLRIALFVAFGLGWFIWAIRNRTYRDWPEYVKGRSIYVVLGLLVVYAFVRGVWLHNAFVFDDANAWVAWALLLPALDIVNHARERLRAVLPYALGVASVWLVFETLTLFYLFSHVTNTFVLDGIYLWIRRTGVGEITRALAGANAWRVFFQSHIYLLPFIISGAWYVATSKQVSKYSWIIWVAAWASLIVSLSRSLFLGVAAGLLVAIGIQLFIYRSQKTGRAFWNQSFAYVSRILAASLAGLFIVAVLFYAPPRGHGSLTDLLASRASTGDDASMSRWELATVLWGGIKKHPILGSGFGGTVTYPSHDPRIVASTGGMYTTYAFEWGWLDHWFKFGLLGIPIMVWLVMRLGWRMWRSEYDLWFRGAMVSSLVALVVTHVFTPYLNHPLGIVWLIALEAMV